MTHVAAPPFAHTSGPRDAKIAIVGEAHGAEEAKVGLPFVGTTGQELTRLLRESGIRRGDCFLTNVIAARPSPTSNNFDLLCGSKAEVGGKSYVLPPLRQGKYLRPEYLPELDRLKVELESVRPNLIVAAGGKASWALLRNAAISRIRGTVTPGILTPGIKVLPTYHPSYLMQVWSDRPVVLADLTKAKREAEFPEFRRPERWVEVNPTLEDIQRWVSETLAKPPEYLSVDIETDHGQIEMIGFATSVRRALVVPFIDRLRPEFSYWANDLDERCAREQCQRLLSSDIPKLGQNFIFDMQYLLREGYRLNAVRADTMLLHHALFPELSKGLGFLGSIYTNEPAWKLMRHRKKEEELKADD